MSVRTTHAGHSQHRVPSVLVRTDPVRFEPIIEDGIYHGMLVQSPLERVALFMWKRINFTLSDITRLRQALTRFQARRAILYVSADIQIPSSFTLLATLSKIAIVREAPVTL
jgi:hypothetical protein